MSVRRCLAVTVVVGAILLVPAPAVADDRGPITDQSGRVWIPHDEAAFLSLPQVSDFDRVIAAVTDGDFRGWVTEEFEGEYFRSTITQRGNVTRSASSGFGTTPTVTYVSGSRACTREATTRRQLSLARDARSTFACRKAVPRDLRGRDWADELTPTAFAREGGTDLVYLVQQQVEPLEAGVLAQMNVVAMAPDLLASYGLVGFVPQRRLTLAVRPDRVDSDLSQGNGYGWSIQWRTVDSTRVPSLPPVMAR